MLALAFATGRECAAALPDLPAPEPGGWTSREIFGRRALVLVTGVGPVCAALALGRLLGSEQVSGLLNLGLAGSFDPARLPLGAVAAADAEIWPEYGLRTQDGVDPGDIGFPLAETPDGPLRDRLPLDPDGAARTLGLILPEHWARGASLTVAAASGDQATAEAMRRAHAPATENMEGFALALGCLRAGLPFLEIRAVSNPVGSRSRAHWNLPLAFSALGRAARILFAREAP